MTWNIHGGGRSEQDYKTIAAEIISVDADIVFLSEIFMDASPAMDSLLADKYSYRTTDFQWCAHYFYSKVPISNSIQIAVDGGNEVIVCSRFTIDDSEFDVYGCHLTSNNCESPEQGRQSIEGISDHRSLWGYFKGIDYASEHRRIEVLQLCDTIRSRGCNSIVMGDMNDISGSSCLRTLANVGFEDAWWWGGFGYGATIHYPLPYRIDHIMYNDGLKLKSIKKNDANGLSDHDALVAEFVID